MALGIGLAALVGIPLALATAVRFRNTFYFDHADEPLWWLIWVVQVGLTYLVFLASMRLIKSGWARRGRVSRSPWHPWNWE